jgi:hypothetical protein
VKACDDLARLAVLIEQPHRAGVAAAADLPVRCRVVIVGADLEAADGLLADLPPTVISDLVGISPVTANRWPRLAGASWSDYLAARQTSYCKGAQADVLMSSSVTHRATSAG